MNRVHGGVMHWKTTTIGALLCAGAAMLTLAGCSMGTTTDPTATATRADSTSAGGGGSTPSAGVTSTAGSGSGTTGTTSTGTTSGTTSGSGSGSTCGSANATTAVQQAVMRIKPPMAGSLDTHWDATHAETAGYDPCATLSWAVVSVEDGTPSSPNAILLFHDGTFLGTATAVQYPFDPTITRSSADAIAVVYHYPKGSDSNANPTGTANATFTWDQSAGKVVMSGSTPPTS